MTFTLCMASLFSLHAFHMTFTLCMPSNFSCMRPHHLYFTLLYFTLIHRMILSSVHLNRCPSDPSSQHPISVPLSSGCRFCPVANCWLHPIVGCRLPTPSGCQLPAPSDRSSVASSVAIRFRFPTSSPAPSNF